MGLALFSAAPACLALFMPAARKTLPRLSLTWGLAAVIGALFVWLLTRLPLIETQGALTLYLPWVPQLGLAFSLYMDGLALLFSLMIVGIGAMIAVYSGYYFEDRDALARFYTLLMAFMSAMLLVVLAGNLLTLFIGWELTSILSFLLIGFDRDSKAARDGALRALIVTGAGGLGLLVGFVLLGTAAGSMELADILSATSLRDHPWYTAATLLILVGCFTKSAQWPFHFWLPGAMSAPTPASAYLHSATMVKAGVYLLLRLSPVLGDTPLWQNGLLAVGLVTMLLGALLALRQRDLKAALAYSTISQLGILVALVSLPDGSGLEAALVGILAHGLYKAALFLVVGAVEHSVGTRQIDRLGGLIHALPGWTVVAGFAGLSMAGLPPLLGFVAKEALMDAMLESPLALAVIVVTTACTVALALIILWDVFCRACADEHDVHESPRGLLVGPAVLAGGSLAGGVGLQLLVVPLLGITMRENVHLSLFSGLNAPFFLSVAAVLGGTAIFATRATWRQWTALALPDGAQLYAGLVRVVERAGDLVLKTQGGKLRYYLIVILLSVVALQTTAGLAHITGYPLEFTFNGSIDIPRILFLILSLGMMFASIVLRNHLMAALSLGVAGYSVGGLFLIEPAPDVALVQFMVETLGTVLLIIMLARIDAQQRQQAMNVLWANSRAGLARDIIISTLIGVGVGLFALAALTSRPKPETIATWHLQHGEELLGFPDVVGAIVTDFRGMDTIIEITVFSISALGVLTLLSKPAGTGGAADTLTVVRRIRRFIRLPRAPEPIYTIRQINLRVQTPDQTAPLISSFSTPLTRVIALIILPFSLLIAMTQLLYGGEGPGDGFTAGVISGLGVALWYIVFGYHETRLRLRWFYPRYFIGAGLTLVIANAALPMLQQMPFLTHVSFDQIVLPAGLHITTTQIYETGIFLTVLGAISMVMEAVAYPKEVFPL